MCFCKKGNSFTDMVYFGYPCSIFRSVESSKKCRDDTKRTVALETKFTSGSIGGGFKDLLFSALLEEMIQFD